MSEDGAVFVDAFCTLANRIFNSSRDDAVVAECTAANVTKLGQRSSKEEMYRKDTADMAIKCCMKWHSTDKVTKFDAEQ